MESELIESELEEAERIKTGTVEVIRSVHLLYSNTFYVSEATPEKSTDETKEHRFVYTTNYWVLFKDVKLIPQDKV